MIMKIRMFFLMETENCDIGVLGRNVCDDVEANMRGNEFNGSLMPSSHLPRTPCDKFVYDFPCDCLGIVGGYGLRHKCSHCLRASCNFFYGASGATRGARVNPYRDCAEIVGKSCNVSAVAVQSPQPPHGNRTEPVGLCNATYDMSTGYSLTIFSPNF